MQIYTIYLIFARVLNLYKMSTFREIIYMILDEMKISTDDSYFTEDHIMYLINKHRVLILKQRYSDIKKHIPESNYQTICLDLIEVPAISGEPCEGGSYLRSKEKVPFLMQIGVPKIYPIDYYQGEITYVSRERMRYIGYNKYLQNIIYCSLGPDNYLYFKSNNPQYLYLEKVKLTGIFEDSINASQLQCSNDKECDILDRTFPLEDSLIPIVIELVVKELLAANYRPKDDINDAKDELSEVATK